MIPAHTCVAQPPAAVGCDSWQPAASSCFPESAAVLHPLQVIFSFSYAGLNFAHQSVS